MVRYNLWVIVWAVVAGHGIALDTPPKQAGLAPAAPHIDPQVRRFLSRISRRTCEQYLADGSQYEISYQPASLQGVNGHCVVTLRTQNHAIGIGSGGPGPVMNSTEDAAMAAILDVASNPDGRLPDSADDLLIEIELTGEEIPLDVGHGALRSNRIDEVLVPCVDGFSVTLSGKTRRVSPSEMILKNLPPSRALQNILSVIPGGADDAKMARFRSAHWYQEAGGAETVLLHRGMTLVGADDVTRERVDHVLASIGRYLAYRQRRDGLFAQDYEPAIESYNHTVDLEHQAGAAWALARFANATDSTANETAAGRILDLLSRSIRDLPGVEGAACVVSPDEHNRLALTCQTYLAMSTQPWAGRFKAPRRRLLAGIIWLQEPDGRFLSSFPPARRLKSLPEDTGLALRVLIQQYEENPTRSILDAINSAIDSDLRMAEDNLPSFPRAAWLLEPVARMAELSNRKDHADFAFALADALVRRQLTTANCVWPELLGGVLQKDAIVPDIQTAIAIPGWVAAVRTARQFDDDARARTYEAASMAAIRFIMQLRFREAEAFYLQNVADVVGGVRTSPSDNRLPVQNLQHAVLAMLAYRALLDGRR